LLAILKLVAVPAFVTFALIIPEQVVKWGSFTTGLMELNGPEKTDILRKLFEKCGKSDWKACENYDADRWAQDSNIYLEMVASAFEKRYGGRLRKTIANMFRPTYIRASFYESMSGDVRRCVVLMGQQIGQFAGKTALDYPTFLNRYNESYGLECGFLAAAFGYPMFADESQKPEAAVRRRIATIEHLTEALAIRADSTIPSIRARLASIQRATLGPANCADLPRRAASINDDVEAIHSTLYGFTDNRTSIRDLEQAEEEATRERIKTLLLTLISLALIALNAKKLGHSFADLWVTISHH
jgi:hypothetical protein